MIIFIKMFTLNFVRFEWIIDISYLIRIVLSEMFKMINAFNDPCDLILVFIQLTCTGSYLAWYIMCCTRSYQNFESYGYTCIRCTSIGSRYTRSMNLLPGSRKLVRKIKMPPKVYRLYEMLMRLYLIGFTFKGVDSGYGFTLNFLGPLILQQTCAYRVPTMEIVLGE